MYRPKAKSSIAAETSVRSREGFYGLRSWNCPDILHREIQQPAAIYLHSRPHISTRSIGMFGLPILDLGHDYNLQPRSCLQILHQKTEQLKADIPYVISSHIHTLPRAQSEWTGRVGFGMNAGRTTDVKENHVWWHFRVNNGSLLAFLHLRASQVAACTNWEYIRLLIDSHSTSNNEQSFFRPF